MNKEFVPYQIAFDMKLIGFDEPCFATWAGETLDMSLQIPSDDYFTKAPTFSQCFRFFRENYGIMHRITSYAFGYQIHLDNTPPNKAIKYIDRRYDSDIDYGTYEEAELACIKRLIKTVKNENN